MAGLRLSVNYWGLDLDRKIWQSAHPWQSLNRSRILKFEKFLDPDSKSLEHERSRSLKMLLRPPLVYIQLSFENAFGCFRGAVYLSYVVLFLVVVSGLAFLRVDLAFFAYDCLATLVSGCSLARPNLFRRLLIEWYLFCVFIAYIVFWKCCATCVGWKGKTNLTQIVFKTYAEWTSLKRCLKVS